MASLCVLTMSCHAFQKNALAASSEDGCADVAGLPLYESH